jgi:hypothetical protein
MYFNHHISQNISKPEPTLEPFILEYPKCSYFYSKQILKKPWKEAEATILGVRHQDGRFSPEYIYLYAKNVLKRRWKEGEKVLLLMSKNTIEGGVNYWAGEARDQLAFYAKNVIKGRWKEAESFIAKSQNIGVYITVLNEQELQEFKNMITLEAIGGSEVSKKFFSWNPTHKVKMKGSKSFDIMLDPDAATRNDVYRHNITSAYRLSEWLNDDYETDICLKNDNGKWLWKYFGRGRRWASDEPVLDGTVTPIV